MSETVNPVVFKIFTDYDYVNDDTRLEISINYNVNLYEKGSKSKTYIQSSDINITKITGSRFQNTRIRQSDFKVILIKSDKILNMAERTINDENMFTSNKVLSFEIGARKYKYELSVSNGDEIIQISIFNVSQNKVDTILTFELKKFKAFLSSMKNFFDNELLIKSNSSLISTQLALRSALLSVAKIKIVPTEIVHDQIEKIDNYNTELENNNMQHLFATKAKESMVTTITKSTIDVEITNLFKNVDRLLQDDDYCDTQLTKINWAVSMFMKSMYGVVFVEQYLDKIFVMNNYMNTLGKNSKIYKQVGTLEKRMIIHPRTTDEQYSFILNDVYVVNTLMLADLYFDYKAKKDEKKLTQFILFIIPAITTLVAKLSIQDIKQYADKIKNHKQIFALIKMINTYNIDRKKYEKVLDSFYDSFSFLKIMTNKPVVDSDFDELDLTMDGNEEKIEGINHVKVETKIDEFDDVVDFEEEEKVNTQELEEESNVVGAGESAAFLKEFFKEYDISKEIINKFVTAIIKEDQDFKLTESEVNHMSYDVALEVSWLSDNPLDPPTGDYDSYKKYIMDKINLIEDEQDFRFNIFTCLSI